MLIYIFYKITCSRWFVHLMWNEQNEKKTVSKSELLYPANTQKVYNRNEE